MTLCWVVTSNGARTTRCDAAVPAAIDALCREPAKVGHHHPKFESAGIFHTSSSHSGT